MITLLLSILVYNAQASDQWLCTQETVQRRGNDILACGTATKSYENSAKAEAMHNTKVEFSQVCSEDSTCRGKAITVTPQRSECEKVGEDYKCTQLTIYTIGDDYDRDSISNKTFSFHQEFSAAWSHPFYGK